MRFGDGKTLQLGDSADLSISHDATDSFITEKTGDLYIKNTADNKDIIFQSDDGSGGTTNYFVVDGSAEQTRFYKDTRHTDGIKANFGNSDDLQIYHDGSNSYIKHVSGASGDLIIEQSVDDADIIFRSDDGSGGVQTYLALDGSSRRVTMPDGVRLAIGNGGDFQLYHNGANSFIENNYNGNLNITNYVDDADIILSSDDGSGGTCLLYTSPSPRD